MTMTLIHQNGCLEYWLQHDRAQECYWLFRSPHGDGFIRSFDTREAAVAHAHWLSDMVDATDT
jgi:hypothetical protein